MKKKPLRSSRPERRIIPPGIALTTFTCTIGVVGLVLLLGGGLTWLNHHYPQNRNEVLRPFISPDGARKAVVFHRIRKGATEVTTHVEILGSDEELGNRPGNAYIARGEANIRVNWVDPHHLLIHEPKNTNVILRAAKVGEVEITGR